ncbi:MAG: NAD(P)H-hydrate dehydratase [Patescibacteria group bacterium]|nr:NAD(P)H-hydrate dehydratase [Patescibacteria group bacterium]
MKNLLKKIYLPRKPWTHKGEHGYVLIVAGSKRYSGSPVFNALSALRAGADLITIIGPKRAMDIAATFAPDLICYPLEGDFLELAHTPEIIKMSQNFNSLVIGGGLGRNKKTLKAIQEIITRTNLPMVIDADAIYAVAQEMVILKNKKAVITPHLREFKILTNEKVLPNVDDRREKVERWAKKLGLTILLKGHVDIISDGRETVFNRTGSVFMTKGGFGDTLAGICGAILARGFSPFESACAAAYINGKAGELAAKKYGESVLASDIFEFIPKVIHNL